MADNIFEMIAKPILKFLGLHSPFIIGIVINIALIICVNKIIDTFQIKIEKKLRERNSGSPLLNLMPILTKIAKSLVVFLLVAGFLQSFGYNVSSLIAGFGITGLAVGFAAKEAIGNIFGSIGLLSDRVYKIGDYIKFTGYEGTVEKINLRSTSIRTLDGFVVNVPNNIIANQSITNVSQTSKRLIDITVGVEYRTSNENIDRAIDILKEIAKENPNIIGEGVFTTVEKLAGSSINLRMFAYTDETNWVNYKKIRSEIIRQIIHKFRESEISFAFPSQSIYIEKQ